MHARPKSVLHSIEIRQKSKTSLWEEKRVVIKCLLYVYICARKGFFETKGGDVYEKQRTR